jgi:hypothetical protein
MKILNHKFRGSTIHYYFEDAIELIVENWGNGNKYWYQNGKIHRTDGPACEQSGGIKQWYIEGEHYSEQAFNQRLKELADLSQT